MNSASVDEFLKLKGIGKAKSQKIINYREQIGCFKSIDELANIDGISQKILLANKSEIVLGVCTSNAETQSASSYLDVLLDPVNIFFVIIIFILSFLDYKTKKDYKSQIVSVGVLGTFVGIFIGLQSFNPDDIINSVNGILVGLKTAFFTSIVGMSASTILSLIEKLKSDVEDE
ncbi:MAG: helix-hairpin-helix domain-containing protein [Sulfurimonas sp.]|nr:helix-hairpin-helix domain-containing protein [Sulfurimonas sp.]